MCIVGSKNAKRDFPSLFARYIARSALRRISLVVRPVEPTEMPTLARTSTGEPKSCERFRERVQNSPCDDHRGLRVEDVLDHHGELVSAESCACVLRPKACLQPARNGDQQVVSRGMAEAVVDRLEVVQVDEENRHQPIAPPRQLERMLHAILEEQAVREPGEGIVKRLVRELLLERTPLGDVASGDDHAGDVAVAEQVVEHGLELARGTVLPSQPEIERHRYARCGVHVLEERAQAIGLTFVQKLIQGDTHELVLLVAENPLDRGCVVPNRQVVLEHGDDVARVLDERPEPLRAAALVEICDERGSLERECDLSGERLDSFPCDPRQPFGRVDRERSSEVALDCEPDQRPVAVVARDAHRARVVGGLSIQLGHDSRRKVLGARAEGRDGALARHRDDRELAHAADRKTDGRSARPDDPEGGVDRDSVDVLALPRGDERRGGLPKGLLALFPTLMTCDEPRKPDDHERKQHRSGSDDHEQLARSPREERRTPASPAPSALRRRARRAGGVLRPVSGSTLGSVRTTIDGWSAAVPHRIAERMNRMSIGSPSSYQPCSEPKP